MAGRGKWGPAAGRGIAAVAAAANDAAAEEEPEPIIRRNKKGHKVRCCPFRRSLWHGRPECFFLELACKYQLQVPRWQGTTNFMLFCLFN
jgi:hypothetical protein